MSDFCDDASLVTERDLSRILAARNSRTEEPWEEDGVRYCLTCGAEIPPARVAAVDAVRCVDCQVVLERQQQLHGGAA